MSDGDAELNSESFLVLDTDEDDRGNLSDPEADVNDQRDTTLAEENTANKSLVEMGVFTQTTNNRSPTSPLPR